MPKPAIPLVTSRKAHGFTLIELMITVAIVGILAVAGLPAFREFVANQRIKSASFDMMAMMTLARSEALKRNTQVIATPTSNDWAKGWTLTTDIPAAGTVISRQSALPGVVVTCYTGGAVVACNTNIVYNSNGRSASALSLQINTSAGITYPSVRCISIDLGGRPNSKKGVC